MRRFPATNTLRDAACSFPPASPLGAAQIRVPSRIATAVLCIPTVGVRFIDEVSRSLRRSRWPARAALRSARVCSPNSVYGLYILLNFFMPYLVERRTALALFAARQQILRAPGRR